MTISAAVLDAMVAAGCTAEQIAAAVKADMAIDEERKASKRANNAERQRRHRERNAMSRVTGVTNGDKRDDAPSSSPSPLGPPPQTPPPIIPQSSSPSPEKKRATRLPADWVLPSAWGRWAIDEGFSEATIRLEAEKFRDYWIGKSGQAATKVDWEATWRNWMRNCPKQSSSRGPPPQVGADGLVRDAQGRVSMADYTSKILQQLEDQEHDGRTIETSYECRNGDGAQQAIPFARAENR